MGSIHKFKEDPQLDLTFGEDPSLDLTFEEPKGPMWQHQEGPTLGGARASWED